MNHLPCLLHTQFFAIESDNIAFHLQHLNVTSISQSPMLPQSSVEAGSWPPLPTQHATCQDIEMDLNNPQHILPPTPHNTRLSLLRESTALYKPEPKPHGRQHDQLSRRTSEGFPVTFCGSRAHHQRVLQPARIDNRQRVLTSHQTHRFGSSKPDYRNSAGQFCQTQSHSTSSSC